MRMTDAQKVSEAYENFLQAFLTFRETLGRGSFASAAVSLIVRDLRFLKQLMGTYGYQTGTYDPEA
jgi:hypothetical protein